MKIRDANKLNCDYLKMSDLDNFFNVYLDKKGNYIFNLNNSLYFDFDPTLLPDYICTHDMHWTLISYLLYGTTRLAWVLLKINNVSTKDIFNILTAGTKVKYIKKEKLESLITTLNEDA